MRDSLSRYCFRRMYFVVCNLYRAVESIPDDIFEDDGFLVKIFLFLGTSGLPVLLYKSFGLLVGVGGLVVWWFLIDSFPHPVDECPPE